MHFPKFDGEDPQYWMTCAYNYFDLYSVDPAMWVSVRQCNSPAPLAIGFNWWNANSSVWISHLLSPDSRTVLS
jgi:hypothetical protein